MRYIFILKIMISENDYRGTIHSIINKLKSLCFNHERKELQTYINDKNYKGAIKTGNILQEKGALDYKFYQLLSFAYLKDKNENRANSTIKKGLVSYIDKKSASTNKFHTSFLEKVENSIFEEVSIKSRHVFKGGWNSMGLLIHTANDNNNGRYITKIIPNEGLFDYTIKRELFFNNYIRKSNKLLQTITPKMISNLTLYKNKIKLLTFEDKGISVSKNIDFDQIIKLNNIISNSITYEEGKELFNKTVNRKDRPFYLLMHKKITHDIILADMNRVSKNIHNSEILLNLINQIESSIVCSNIYKMIKPERDYVFSHSDFHIGNIIFDQCDSNYYSIDWTHYGFGFKGNDLATFLSSCNIDFTTIESCYLSKIINTLRDDPLEKVFFIYRLLIHWFSEITVDKADVFIDKKISPAVNYLEILVEEFNEND